MESRSLWIDDNLVSRCVSCHAPFGLLLRRHHCRVCGYIFCHKCLVDLGTNSEPGVPLEERRGIEKMCRRCLHMRKLTVWNKKRIPVRKMEKGVRSNPAAATAEDVPTAVQGDSNPCTYTACVGAWRDGIETRATRREADIFAKARRPRPTLEDNFLEIPASSTNGSAVLSILSPLVESIGRKVSEKTLVPFDDEWFGEMCFPAVCEVLLRADVPLGGRFTDGIDVVLLNAKSTTTSPKVDVMQGVVVQRFPLSNKMPTERGYSTVLLLAQTAVDLEGRVKEENVTLLDGATVLECYYEKLWHRIHLVGADIIVVEGELHYSLQSRLSEMTHTTTVANVSSAEMRSLSIASGAAINSSVEHLLPDELAAGDFLGAVEDYKALHSDTTVAQVSCFTGLHARRATVLLTIGHDVTTFQADGWKHVFMESAHWALHHVAHASFLKEIHNEGKRVNAPKHDPFTVKELLLERAGTDRGEGIHFCNVVRLALYGGNEYQTLVEYLAATVLRAEKREEDGRRLFVCGERQISQRVEKGAVCNDPTNTATVKSEPFVQAQRLSGADETGAWTQMDDTVRDCITHMNEPLVAVFCSRCYEAFGKGAEKFVFSKCSVLSLNRSFNSILYDLITDDVCCAKCRETASVLLFDLPFPAKEARVKCWRVEFRRSPVAVSSIVLPSEAPSPADSIDYTRKLTDQVRQYAAAVGSSLQRFQEELLSLQNAKVVKAADASSRMLRLDERLRHLIDRISLAVGALVDSHDYRETVGFLHGSWRPDVLQAYESFVYAVHKIPPLVPLLAKCQKGVGRLGLFLVEGDQLVVYNEPSSFIAYALRRLQTFVGGTGNGNGVSSVSFQGLGASCHSSAITLSVAVDVFYDQKYRQLRSVYLTESEDAFLLSLSRCEVHRTEGGKSNADFYRTVDDRYLLKLVKQAELEHFHTIGASLLEYHTARLASGEKSALVPILGLYTVKISVEGAASASRGEQSFLVMQNVAAHIGDVIFQYDLKGSQRNRVAPESSPVRLDADLLQGIRKEGRYFFLTSAERGRLMGALQRDLQLLLACRVMDYSLVVYGVRRGDGGQCLSVGIIDYLHPFTSGKKIESTVKSGIDAVWLGQTSQECPTIIDPQRYGDRFLKWMAIYFCDVPSPDS